MARQIGRSSALVFTLAILAVVGLTAWAADAASGGKIRQMTLSRLAPVEKSGTSRSVASRPGEMGRSRGRTGVGSNAGATSVTALKIVDPDSSCTISGMVTDEEMRPVAGVKITVNGPDGFSRSDESDAQGRFTVSAIPTGTFDVFAKHSDYVHLHRPGFTLARVGQVTELDFRLPLGATINGIVKDEEGKPLTGVRVLAQRRSLKLLEGGDVYVDDASYKTEKTDREGTFTVTGVSLGGNVIEFHKPGYEGELKRLDVKGAKEQPKLEVTLRRTGTLGGVVKNDSGNRVSTVTVHLVRYKPINGPAEVIEKGKLTATAGDDGQFEFSKLYTEGFYDLWIDDERFAPVEYPLVPVGASEVTCVVGIGGVMEGKVQYLDRTPTEASVLLVAETMNRGTTFTKEVKSDGNGQFVLDRLPYGKYNITIRESGLAAEPKRDVVVERNKWTRDVVVEVFEASTVRGRVVDGRTDGPVPGAMVAIDTTYGPNGSRRRTFQARADMHGGFALYRLPAGTHVARASARGFLKTISDRSQTSFALQPGERKADVALVLDRGGMVDGFVLDHVGRPVRDAEIQLYAASNLYGNIDTREFKGRTDLGGHFVISGIEVGERTQLYASARHQSYAKASSRIIDLTPRNPEATTQIEMRAGGVVTGRVTDKSDLPIPGTLLRFESGEFPGDPSPSAVTAQARPDGTYVLSNVPPGQGAIAVSRSGYVKQSKGVAVKIAEPTGNVNFKLDAGLQIEGTVSALDGKPIPNAKVTAHPLSGATGSDEAVTDRKGQFTLSNLGAGGFKLSTSFKLSTPEGDQFYQFVSPRVEAGRKDALFDCDVGNLITGTVVDQNGRGIDGVTVALRSHTDTKPAQDFVFNLDRAALSKGSFHVHNTPRGIYSMRVTAEGYEPYVKEDVAIGPTPRTDLTPVRLRSAGGVRGALVSSSTRRPVNGVSVRLIDIHKPEAEARATAPAGTSNASGEFKIMSALEGTYDVEFSHPSYMLQKKERITVTTRRMTDLGKLSMEAGGAIRGTVLDAAGNPVIGMRMKVSGLSKETHTDRAGNYLIQGVQAGRWNVVARGSVNERTVYSFLVAAVQPDETEFLDFRMETNADLNGMLLAATDRGRVKTGDVRIHPFDENAIVLEDIHYDATAAPATSAFEIRQVPPGPYFLWATGIGAANTAYTAWQTLNLERGRNETVVKVGTASLEGKALDESALEAVTQVGVQLRPLFETLRLPQGIYDKLVRNATVGMDGGFAFENLQSGPYQMLYQPAQDGLFAQPPIYLGDQQVVNNYNLLLPASPR